MSATALITTTINVPHLLAEYAADAKAHARDVKIYAAGDRKTPAEAAAFCAGVARDSGIACEYLDCAAQEALLRPYAALNAHLPWDCVQRRNAAVLKAAMDGAETVITIDDDNFVCDSDYFGAHMHTGEETTLDTFGEDGQWFNVCRFLEEESGRRFFHRGYGIAARQNAESAPPAAAGREKRRVAVNAGLWLGDPDIDATTRLAAPVNATRYARDENFFVAAGAFTPFNSQNTAIARHALPAYFLSPYVGRYDDIFISFAVKRIADHLGDGVCFGRPLVRQKRNPHNLLNDLALENLGTKLTDDFTASLRRASLRAGNYRDCLLELCPQSEEIMRATAMTLSERAQLAAFYAGCRLWAELPLW